MQQLSNLTMSDGSRYFWGSGAYGCASEIWKLLSSLPTTDNKKKVSSLDETWIEFMYEGYPFAIHDHWSGVSFYAEDPMTPDHHLRRVLQHLVRACEANASN